MEEKMYGKGGLYGGIPRRDSRQMKKYTARSGDTIWLDVSPEAFRRHGFKEIRHESRMLDPVGDESIAIGFARSDFDNKTVLWYQLMDNERVGFYSGSVPSDYQKIK